MWFVDLYIGKSHPRSHLTSDLIDISESNLLHKNALHILDEKRIGTAWYSNTDWIHRPMAQTMGLIVAQKCIGDLLFGDDGHGLFFFDDQENCKLKYKQWIDSVIEHVPEERLLVFHVVNGYEPLCQFLDGLHIPQYVDFEPKPFPRVNCPDTPSTTIPPPTTFPFIQIAARMTAMIASQHSISRFGLSAVNLHLVSVPQFELVCSVKEPSPFRLRSLQIRFDLPRDSWNSQKPQRIHKVGPTPHGSPRRR